LISKDNKILIQGSLGGDHQVITISESVFIVETTVTKSSRIGLDNTSTKLDVVFGISDLNKVIDKREELERIYNWAGWRREDRQDNPGPDVS
jgi:hypothetical protein